MHTPQTYEEFQQHWQANFRHAIHQYTNYQYSFIPNLLPEQALKMSDLQVLEILQQRLGSKLMQALNPDAHFPSPLVHHKNTDWLKTTNMVGINVRTIQNFWNIIKYALTLSAQQQSIHILPIWEPGVVASLYGMSSWNINPEFYSQELAALIPTLDTVEKQLKVVVNILHAMNKAVGMDVIPHTDRYSEIVLANPNYFEWLQRKDLTIIDHSARLHERVQQQIMRYLFLFRSAVPMPYPGESPIFFSAQFPESERLKVLFGQHRDYSSRLKRRNQIIQFLYNEGLEPVPATMAPPYRGLEVDPNPEAKTIDADGRIWRDYRITKPQKMSRVFGPLTRYKLYDCLKDNANWELNFDAPKKEVWDYVCQKYDEVQTDYNFDFMRGDMSHVQMLPSGVPEQVNEFYDIHKAIKRYCQNTKPYFGYFAETFLAPPNEMGYGDEVAHLVQSEADTTLGDLQSMVVGSERFVSEFARYYQIATTTSVVPNFTIMTADKDDPRFDEFYLTGNEVRFFCALFLTDLPSYMGLGFEVRDIHHTPAPNEHYTKLYVFQVDKGPKATSGAYVWGKNGRLFHHLNRIKCMAEQILPNLQDVPLQWLVQPDPTGLQKHIVWKIGLYIFAVNFNTEKAINIAHLHLDESFEIIFSTMGESFERYLLDAGEGRIYKC